MKIEINGTENCSDKLSEEAILNSIKKTKQKKSRGKITLRICVSAVLVLAIVFGSTQIYEIMKLRRINYTPDTILSLSVKADYPENITTFSDYSDIMSIFRTKAKQLNSGYSFGITTKSADKSAETADIMDFVAETATSDGTGSGNGEYSTTNLRDENADEPDTVKTDGKNLYVLSSYEDDYGIYRNKIEIVDISNPLSATISSTISCFVPDEKFSAYIQNFFLYKNKLIIIENLNKDYRYFYNDEKSENSTDDNFILTDTELWEDTEYCIAIVYDISNPASPLFCDYYAQKGSMLDARIVNDNLILVSNDYVNTYMVLEGDLNSNVCVPSVITNNSEEYLPIDNIIAYDTDNETYLNILGINLSDLSAEPSALSILGAGSEIYCNGENLFVAEAEYSYCNNTEDWFNYTLQNGETIASDVQTCIFRFSIQSGEIIFTGSANIPGTQNGQFSMDEYNGYFRIATTVSGYLENEGTYSTNSALFVLDSNLQIVGAIKNLMENERVYGVRFMGDTAYIVTFEQTDPLFVIDLSNPENPQVTGQLEIYGFSEYLHPAGDGLLIGIGYDGNEDGTNDGTKVSLFDVSNPQKLTEINKITIGNSYLYNFTNRAFLVGNNGMYGYPVCIWHDQVNGTYQYNETYGIQTFTIENGELTATGFYKTADSSCSWFSFIRAIANDNFVLIITDRNIAVYENGKPESAVCTITF